MLLESLPKMNLLIQSDTTKALVRQLTCLLNDTDAFINYRYFFSLLLFFFFWVINHRYFLSSKQYVRQRKQEEELTLHRQNTKATESCGQLKPNLPEAGQLFVPLLMEQIVQDACT